MPVTRLARSRLTNRRRLSSKSGTSPDPSSIAPTRQTTTGGASHSVIEETKINGWASPLFLLQCRYVATLKDWRPNLPNMTITKLSSRDFNQDTSRAKRAAKRGPVFITDRGRPSHVLLTVEEYQRITGGQESVLDLLAMPAAAEIEFEPPRLRRNLHEPADLT